MKYNIPSLSPREEQILWLIAQEQTSHEIGIMLHISMETARTHRKNLMQKLQARNAAGLIRRGFEVGVLQVDVAINM
ncbi:MAG: helix-turn-helix transcriptional regulator [Saprospiraceae bacterium]|nr:helix-turn-helix transcriptional regulator [Saprospiraceae bacterium]